MAKILFVPICSKCEKIIRQHVDYKYDDTEINPSKPFKDLVIEPECCPNCGEYFQAIIIPDSLYIHR